MRSVVVLGVALIVITGLTTPATGSEPTADPRSHTAAKQKKAPRGTLAVKITGSGSYRVLAKKKTVRKANRTKAFRLTPGTYRVLAKGAVVSPAKVRLRSGKTVTVKVAFPNGSTPPTTTPIPTTPEPTPTPTPTPTVPIVPGQVVRVSVDSQGGQGNKASFNAAPAFSPDGTKVVFESEATNLVPGDTNSDYDVFVKDLLTGQVQRISTSGTGQQGDLGSYTASWSPDGTRIAFISQASNLVSGDTNSSEDLFVKDLATGAVQRATTASDGGQATAGTGNLSVGEWSPDGTRLAFSSSFADLVPGDNNGASDVFVKNLQSGQVSAISATAGQTGDSHSGSPTWSPDGTQIAFLTTAQNLIPGTDTNGSSQDILAADLTSGALRRVSINSSLQQANGDSFSPHWSSNGKIAFVSDADNLDGPTINAGVFAVDPNAVIPNPQRVDTSADGTPSVNGNTPRWSPDGKMIAFRTSSAFSPEDTNLDMDVYTKSLDTGVVHIVSIGEAGAASAGFSAGQGWAPDNKRLVFWSPSNNLVPGDTNVAEDVFVKTLR